MKPSILQFSACIINVGIALAAPNPDTQLEARAPKCKDSLVTSVFSVHSAEATPFCSSYLHIPIKTSKVTTTLTITPSPKTVTTKVPVTAYSTVTITDTTPGPPITYYYNAPYPSNTKTIYPTPPPAKRTAISDMEARAVNQLPMYVSGYPPGQIKSACSCLSITPSTTTSTKTKTTLHKATTTVTAYTTVTTVTSTTTTTIEGPRPTVSTCYDYQNSPLNTGYEYLNINDTSHLTMLDNVPIFSRDLIDCCNLCYETPNCVVYRFNNDHSTATCQRWVTPGDEELEVVGYNEMCREGLVEGQRQPITEKDFFGNMAGAIAIGPCLVADWVN